jgi:hypothetical protein
MKEFYIAPFDGIVATMMRIEGDYIALRKQVRVSDLSGRLCQPGSHAEIDESILRG